MFVVLEGIDGAGTTTSAALLKQRFPKSIVTREPNRTSIIGSVIDKWLTKKINLCEKAGFHLFLADRYQHIQDTIKPALDGGCLVFCDRYVYSTWVYQQDCIDPDLLKTSLSGVVAPDYVFILDAPAGVAMARKQGSVEHFEVLEKQVRYRQRYLDVAYNNSFRLGGECVHVIDSNLSVARTVVDNIARVLHHDLRFTQFGEDLETH